jgi:hypothetical protein
MSYFNDKRVRNQFFGSALTCQRFGPAAAWHRAFSPVEFNIAGCDGSQKT